jgi:hypothetical protein
MTHHPEDPHLLEQHREASGVGAFTGFYRRTIAGRKPAYTQGNPGKHVILTRLHTIFRNA